MKKILVGLFVGVILLTGCTTQNTEENETPAKDTTSEETLSDGEPMNVPTPPQQWTKELAVEQLFYGKPKQEIQELYQKVPSIINENTERYSLGFPDDYDYIGSELDTEGLSKHQGVIVTVEYDENGLLSTYQVDSIGESGEIIHVRNNGSSKTSK